MESAIYLKYGVIGMVKQISKEIYNAICLYVLRNFSHQSIILNICFLNGKPLKIIKCSKL